MCRMSIMEIHAVPLWGRADVFDKPKLWLARLGSTAINGQPAECRLTIYISICYSWNGASDRKMQLNEFQYRYSTVIQ